MLFYEKLKNILLEKPSLDKMTYVFSETLGLLIPPTGIRLQLYKCFLHA